MTTSIVITGATGFIGRALCKRLEEKKEFSIIKVTRSTKLKSGFCHVTSYQKTPPGDILIHLGEDPDRSSVNKIGDKYRVKTGYIMESLLKKGYKNIIYCSSSVVYGDKGTEAYKEDMITFANDTYSQAKLENEKRILSSNGIVVRFSNVIGYGMSKNTVLQDILRQIPEKGSLKIFNTQPIKDFILIDDVVDAIINLINKDASGIFNIGSGVATSIYNLIELVLDQNDQHGREIKSTITNPEYSYNVLNIDHIKKATGWKPKFTLSQSLKKCKILKKKKL